ncbi:MAG: hypothetical protein ACJA2Y_000110 [Cycloclasticus pugetii]|jgi:uncharacterized protein (UPF0276 family)|uniref:HvfB family MNIO-type RiPP peptide maturase n=1 Tax=Cycloclasticus pugetii TaxID=34068 RepID=UPI0009208E35|nr:DUF692 domain-containing protein [Cycloclasticus pugetii]SHI62387.1 hypothetical protein SAMN05519226_0659 [Cycloclasticus pugetii]
MINTFPVHGVGLGLRRAFIGPLVEKPPSNIGFYEIAPENWIKIGGRYGKQLRALTEQFPFVAHGLSLSLGSPDPLDVKFIRDIRDFIKLHQIKVYTEHLSYCSDGGHLYDLMPIPFTQQAVEYVAERILYVQDILGQQIAIENASYYAAPGKEMEEIDFINAVIKKADCKLLVDINNIYVNSVNHKYSAEEFLKALPGDRISYAHIAGHYNEADDIIIDSHGANVIDPVWQLLDKAYDNFGLFPTLLERDFNIPPLPELLDEVNLIHQAQLNYSPQSGQKRVAK